MVGRTISHYKILEKLGEGGMGIVYKAQDVRLDRPIALKILPAEAVANPERRRRFVQEARSASALNHPNIVHIYDIGEEDEVAFIAMEYVGGKTLDACIPAKGMRLSEVLRISVEIADALAAAHGAGVVHRDLKPGNIMIGEDGRVRVLDFGLAKLVEPAPSADQIDAETLTDTSPSPQTAEGSIVGTVSYMSPEQAEGRPVDGRSDIFSFGCLLYEMLTGRRAFRGGSNMSTLAAILKDDPVPASTITDELPAELDRVVHRCLRKDPDRRFQTMKDLKVALDELKEELDSGTLVAVPSRRPQRYFSPLPLVVVVALVAIVATVIWLWLGRARSPVETAFPTPLPLTSYAGNEMTPALSPDGNQVAFSWSGSALRNVQADTPDGAGDASALPNYDIYVKLVSGGEPLRLTTSPAFDWAPAWSPDGSEILFYRYWPEGKFAVVSVPPLSGRERILGEYPFPPALPIAFLVFLGPAWSPDGRCTAHPGEAGVVLRPSEGESKIVADIPGGGELHPAFAPDGRSLAFVWQAERGNSALYLLALTPEWEAAGEPRRLVSNMRFINRPIFTPDGREILFSADTGTGMGLWRVDSDGRDSPQRIVPAGSFARFPTLSRDGRRLVYEHHSESSSLWRVAIDGTTDVRERLTASTRGDWTPAYSPDGRRIAFISDRSGSLEIWMADADGSRPVQLTSLKQYSVLPAWSPDGSQILFQSAGESGNELYLVGAEGGGIRRITNNDFNELQPSWSPDGEWIYFTSDRGGSHQIWRIPAEGGDATPVTVEGGEFARVSPDGPYLYFTKGEYGSLELWRMSPGGEHAVRLDVPPLYDWGFALAHGRIYFSTAASGGSYPILTLDLKSGKTDEVARITHSPFAKFSVSADGKWLVYSQQEEQHSDLMLVDGFH